MIKFNFFAVVFMTSLILASCSEETSKNVDNTNGEETINTSVKNNPLDSLSVIQPSGWADKHDNKYCVYGKILNRSLSCQYKDFVIEIEFFSKTETSLGKIQSTIYEKVKPLEEKRISFSEKYNDMPEGTYDLKWKLISATEIK